MHDYLFHNSLHYIDTAADLRSRSLTLNFVQL